MEQNSTETPAELDLDALINPPNQESAMTVSSPVQSTTNLKQDPNALADGESFKVTHNPIFTQNGASGSAVEVIDLTRPVKTEGESSSESTTSLPNSDSIMRVASTPTIAGMGAMSAMSQFGGPMSISGSQLTPEEHSAAYKKANILAITALTKSGGSNAKELLAVQHKLQEFLTSLITLASQKGPQLKTTVQLLVQKLVTGTITEEEFASRVEQDLQSQHQPSLLPFLKNSVPSLKTRLQLQQAIMKQLLLQRHQKQQTTTPAMPTSHQSDPSQQQQQQQQTQPPPSNKQQPQQQDQTSQQINLTTQQQVNKPQQQPGTTPPTLKPPTNQHMVSQSSSQVPSIKHIPPTSSMQQTSQTLMGFSKLVSDPEAQRKVLEMQMQQQAMALAQQQRQGKSSTANTSGGSSSSATVSISNSIPSTATLHNASMSTVTVQAMLERQQQFAKEKLAMDSAKGGVSTPIVISNQQGGTNFTTKSASNALSSKSTSSSSVLGKTTFSNMKIVPSVLGASPSASPASSSHSKGRHKASGGKGKDVSVEEEEEDEGMDIAGVNLQEESVLPQTVAEGVSRTCKDEHLLDLRTLRWKIAPIASRYGITEITDDFLSLLSHATQERLTDILEKLSVISQHRLETMKDNPQYQVVSEVKGQLKVLEAIDRINDKRKQEREKEKIMRAAKSRSKGDDPAMAVMIKQQAKQLQQEEEAMILNQAANMRALAAIGTRKRPLQPDPSSRPGDSSSSAQSEASSASSLFGPSGAVRQTKRRITSRDALFHLEQERETRKSVFLYKNFLK